MEQINSNDMAGYGHKKDWEVRLEYVAGTANKFYSAGCSASGAYYIKYGRCGTKGQMRDKSSGTDPVTAFQEIQKLIAGKLKKGYKNTVLNASYGTKAAPATKPAKPATLLQGTPSHLINAGEVNPPVGPCSVWLRGFPARRRIHTIKALRQLFVDIGAPAGLGDAKRVLNEVDKGGCARLIRYISTANGDELERFLEAAAQIGMVLSYKKTPEEVDIDLSSYQMFRSVDYIRMEKAGGLGMAWRGYDKQDRKLMVVPDTVINENGERILGANEQDILGPADPLAVRIRY